MTDLDPFAAIAQRIVPGAQLVRTSPLVGGVSANLHRLEIRSPEGTVHRVVVRRPGANDWKPQTANTTAREFGLHQALFAVGVAVPEPLHLDESCEVFPTPYFVMQFVEGHTEIEENLVVAAMQQMAVFLSELHALAVEPIGLAQLPDLEDPVAEMPQYLPSDELGLELRECLAQFDVASANPTCLLHGDFWPGNVLWHEGRIAAVVDWEDASLGDPLSDLACARVEILCAYGEAAMEAFTRHYLAAIYLDCQRLSLWEVYVSAAALSSMAQWGLTPEVEAARRDQTQQFFERAARQLIGQRG